MRMNRLSGKIWKVRYARYQKRRNSGVRNYARYQQRRNSGVRNARYQQRDIRNYARYQQRFARGQRDRDQFGETYLFQIMLRCRLNLPIDVIR